ncbi:tRNA (guanine-N(7)-)-methyltransferase non-catalytic subunit wdr4-like isoform X2 [Amphiura filiformis]|uniref:tRNA (guanine-N(7)-)-methyltransferase non-catalytic subunit wdr4-like isoform X2 n=1 Tax=Amphiura filiformis TaxID=82378 RepID=UPI003B214077
MCDDYKQLTVWKAKTEWESSSTRTVSRRCIALAFNHKEDTIYVGDKSGDVYSYSLNNQTEDGVLLVGHISMLLDVVVSQDDRFIMTADRDEKIRVSCLPNSYHIQTFCLGHTQFVSRLAVLPNLPNVLVSGSGDGTVRFWNYIEGHQLHCISLDSTHQERSKDDSAVVDSETGENGDSASSSVAKVEDQVDRPTVTCIACCRTQNIVAVSLLNNPSVLLYQVTQSNSELECVQLCTLDSKVSPWSLCFDDSDQLWILRPVETQPLVVYSLSEESGNIKLTKLDPTTSTSNTSKLITKINDNTQFFKDSYNQESFYSTLHKRQIDNMGHYLERKHQREEFQKQKKEAGQVKGQGSKKQKTN